jgi:hypothetical protein
VHPVTIMRWVCAGELRACQVASAKGERWLVELPERAPLPHAYASGPVPDTAVALASEVPMLREMVAILREQLDQKEVELDARRREIQALVEGHQQQVQQLHVLLLRQGQRHPLVTVESSPRPELPTSSPEPAAPDAPAPEPDTAAPTAPTPAAPWLVVTPDGTELSALVGRMLAIATTGTATTEEWLTLQELAAGADLAVPTAWQYGQEFADCLVRNETVGVSPAGRIWGPVNVAYLRAIHTLYTAGCTTEMVHQVLATAPRPPPRLPPPVPPPPAPPPRPWWQRLWPWAI